MTLLTACLATFVFNYYVDVVLPSLAVLGLLSRAGMPRPVRPSWENWGRELLLVAEGRGGLDLPRPVGRSRSATPPFVYVSRIVCLVEDLDRIRRCVVLQRSPWPETPKQMHV